MTIKQKLAALLAVSLVLCGQPVSAFSAGGDLQIQRTDGSAASGSNAVRKPVNRVTRASESTAERLEDLEELKEKEGLFPEFYYREDFDGVTVTISAREGILPEGTQASIQEVLPEEVLSRDIATSSEPEKQESAKQETQKPAEEEQQAFYYDITLYGPDGEKLPDDWQKKGSVKVEFSGERIQEAKAAAKKAEILYVPDSGKEEVVRSISMTRRSREAEGLSFSARHFSTYGVRFMAAAPEEVEAGTLQPLRQPLKERQLGRPGAS